MFYFPGSWYVGTFVQWFANLWVAIEFWPFHLMDPFDWDDRERRGAGSLCILLVLITAVVIGVIIGVGYLKS